MKKILLLIVLILLASNSYAIVGLPNQQGIAYNPNDPTDQIDWYNPTTGGATCTGTTPLIIWAAGGGFTNINKNIAYSLDPWKTLLNNCYAIMSVKYTVSPTQSMDTKPIMPDDLAAAVKYARKNDANYNINENKIIAMGQSAGADIWMYPVYGPDMNYAGGDFNTQDARPNYFISIAGWTDINAVDNSVTGALFNDTTLATVSVADKNRMSMVSMLDTNAVLFPNRIIPTLFLSNGAADATLPIGDPHDAYFGDLGLAKINQYNPNTGSADYNLPTYTNNTPYIIDWLNTNVGSALSDSPNSLSFFDDFNGYNTSYAANGSFVTLYDFQAAAGWTISEDFNTGFLVPGSWGGKLSSTAISWPLDMDKNSAQVSSVYRSITSVTQLRDWNATGAYIYIMWKTDQNVEMSYLQVGIGQGINDYFIYRRSAGTDWITPWNNGYMVTRYDLNAPFPGTVGNPNLTDVNFLRITTAYTGSQVDFNLTIDRVWVENYSTSMDDTWVPLKDGNKLYGWSMPFTDQNSGLVVADSNIINTNNYGVVINNTFNSLDISGYDFNVQVDVNQIDTNQFTKIVFDYTNQDNYSSCYIYDKNSTGRMVGIEKITAGVRSFVEGETNFAYQTKHVISCYTSGSTVTVKVDDEVLKTTTIARVDGSFGLMSVGGTTKFQNYYNTLQLIVEEAETVADNTTEVIVSALNGFGSIQGLLVVLFLAFIIFIVIVVAMVAQGNSNVSIEMVVGEGKDLGIIIAVVMFMVLVIAMLTGLLASIG